MFQAPDYTQTASLRLSEVLTDIGVDEGIIMKGRRSWLLTESLHTRSLQLDDIAGSVYFLGSLSERTTTMGLESDTDILICHNGFNVMQDLSGWKHGMINYLMIQDETVSPGYCLLQYMRSDAPLPYDHVPNEHYVRDKTGRILLKNTLFFAAAAGSAYEGGVRHGPAHVRQGHPGDNDADIVFAFPCKSWPLQARHWLAQEHVHQWPSEDMKRYCSSTRCFVVAVGSKGSENEVVEWRISTSLAERCLMFNLNITQIRCYIMMKMILKSYIKPNFEDAISSYMCKTVLFQCIANTHFNVWRENNLLVCLSLCLFVLYNSILNEICPHFIIPKNNLMRGHISHESKPYILEILQCIINNEGRALLGIECDALGARLLLKFNYLLSFSASDTVSGQLLYETARNSDMVTRDNLTSIRNSGYEVALQTLLKYIFKLVIISNGCQGIDKTACYLVIPRFCTTLGSVLASLNIQKYKAVSAKALTWMSLGLNTDVASGKLKLASMLYCTEYSQGTELVLRDIKGSYALNIVEPICCCHDYIHLSPRRGFDEISGNHTEEAIHYTTALCVKFLPSEINCVPHELRYEMFRSTEEDLAFRSRNDNNWMGSAVVDSLPYLYFLQYKTYRYLGRQEDKQRALSNLARTTGQEPNLGHRETALNLLGQCMEQEQKATDALHCYFLSLNLRERNNAAKFHICRLLCSIINGNKSHVRHGYPPTGGM